jgi:hypothetical protein
MRSSMRLGLRRKSRLSFVPPATARGGKEA